MRGVRIDIETVGVDGDEALGRVSRIDWVCLISVQTLWWNGRRERERGREGEEVREEERGGEEERERETYIEIYRWIYR